MVVIANSLKFINGIPASPGIAMGKAHLIERGEVTISEYSIRENQVEKEIRRFQSAREKSRKQLLKIKEKMKSEEGAERNYILETQLLILDDTMLVEDTVRRIQENQVNAEWALKKTVDRLAKAFSEMGDEYFRERRSDIDFVGDRILRNLIGRKQLSISKLREKVIIVAHDLSPAETAQMSRDEVLGFVTDIGGKTSHTAIMARSLEIPAVVGLEWATRVVSSGDFLIVDGLSGIVRINPPEEICKEFQEIKDHYISLERELHKSVHLPAQTTDSYGIRLMANIETAEDVSSGSFHGAEGVGLYRTEFLYLNRKRLPDEEEHFRVYKTVGEKTAPQPAVIRTLDLGGDKFLSHLDLAKEMNPALGLRAIRFCLHEKGIFKEQLRGILRASVFGKLKIMFPMISGMQELEKAKEILEQAKAELDERKISYDREIEVGIMIETPSAVLIAEDLAKKVQFFSIGTNDLIQYTLAIDRVNEHVAYLYEPLHPAILRMIKQVVDAGQKYGVEVGMCGEMAGDPLYTMVLMGLGLDSLSMNPVSIPRIKEIIRSVKYQEARSMVKKILKFSSTQEIEDYVRKLMTGRFPEYFEKYERLTTQPPEGPV